jgi:glutaminyl-peptide cyclotransferase
MVTKLNELEYIQGLVFANIWGDKKIAVIEPSTGKVKAYLDMTSVIPDELKSRGDKVLNGIAYNPDNGHLFVTGKNWPILFEIKLTEGFDKI